MNTELRPVSMDEFSTKPLDPPNQPEEIDDENDWEPQQPMMFHHPPPHMMGPPMHNNAPPVHNPLDMDKTMYIVLFVAFILGFFMGKTMQPIIVKSM